MVDKSHGRKKENNSTFEAGVISRDSMAKRDEFDLMNASKDYFDNNMDEREEDEERKNSMLEDFFTS
jgi:hypothetical protein